MLVIHFTTPGRCRYGQVEPGFVSVQKWLYF